MGREGVGRKKARERGGDGREREKEREKGEEQLVKECGICRQVQCCAACLQHEDHVHNHTEEDVSSNIDNAPARR